MCLGIVGTIDRIWSEGGFPMASVGGEPVALMYTPEASVGDSILIHLGFSIEVLGEDRAASARAHRLAWAEPELTRETS